MVDTTPEIQDLKKRIDHLQYDEINPLKNEVNDMKVTLSKNDLLTEQTLESNKKLTETMEAFKVTMIDVSQNVRDSSRVTGQLADTVEKLNNKITLIEDNTNATLKDFGSKIDNIDNKSKLDIVEWVKNNWFSCALGLGALIYAITQIIK